MVPASSILSFVFLLLVTLTTASFDGDATKLAEAIRERRFTSPERSLKAATKAAHLAKRHSDFFTATQIELTYAERTNLDETPNFGATIHCDASVPVLLLEDFEHLTSSISCHAGQIIIDVLPGVDVDAARNTLLSLVPDGLIITSHYGCNAHGERQLFRVGNVSAGKTSSVFEVEAKLVSWESAFQTLGVEMYQTSESHTLRPHGKSIQRREAAQVVSTVTDNQFTYDIPKPTATPTAGVSTLDLAGQLLDTSLFSFENSTLQVSCKNCSTFGTVDASFVSFNYTNGEVHGGEFELVAHGMGAHVELVTNITGDAVFEVPLLAAAFGAGIAIPGFGLVGLLYVPRLHVDYKINGTLSFTYGFEANIPDNSRLFIDMTEPSKSNSTGFQHTSVAALPFQASVDVGTAVVEITLRHEIGVALEAFGTGADIGIYLDLPKYQADFAHVAGVDADCKSLAESKSDDKNIAQKVLTDVYNITPSIDWQVGVAGKAKAFYVFSTDFDDPFDNGSITDTPPSCLQYDKTSGRYLDAKDVVTQAKKKSAAAIASAKYLAGWAALAGFIACLSA